MCIKLFVTTIQEKRVLKVISISQTIRMLHVLNFSLTASTDKQLNCYKTGIDFNGFIPITIYTFLFQHVKQNIARKKFHLY